MRQFGQIARLGLAIAGVALLLGACSSALNYPKVPDYERKSMKTMSKAEQKKAIKEMTDTAVKHTATAEGEISKSK